MIKLCESQSDLDFMKADPFSIKIMALFTTYGTSYDFARFYFQSTDETRTAAISIVDGNVTVYGESIADFNELAEFISFIGYASVQTHADIIDKLGIKIGRTSYIVKYSGSKSSAPKYFSDSFNPREIYNLLTECGFDMGNYSCFLSDICTRLNRNTAAFGCISIDGKPVSCAFRLFESDIGVLLGAVATMPEHRRNGYSVGILKHIVSATKPTFLLTRNDSLLDFYVKCGFSPIGRWATS